VSQKKLCCPSAFDVSSSKLTMEMEVQVDDEDDLMMHSSYEIIEDYFMAISSHVMHAFKCTVKVNVSVSR
jgi:hypothetical protein